MWRTVERQWKNVIFSDESQIVVDDDVWRQKREGFRTDVISNSKK
jgi:hypothetical protein